METLIKDFYDIFTLTWSLALLNIIIIDLVMSWDNAIIIWMATNKLPENLRKKAINIWIILATILRIILAIFALELMKIAWLNLVWWLLLIYVVWKFYKELRQEEKHESEHNLKASTTLSSALYTIVIADVSMSLDNVLWVSWAAHNNIAILWIWLIFSILLMAFASSYIAKKLDDYPQIQWVWLFVILFVAIEMIIKWSHDVEDKILHLNILPLIIFICWSLFVFLHKKYLKPLSEEKIKNIIDKHHLNIILWFLVSVFLLLFFWEIIFKYIESNIHIFYTLLLLNFFITFEVFMYIIWNKKRKHPL
jgi:YjbE family integral membrane protein